MKDYNIYFEIDNWIEFDDVEHTYVKLVDNKADIVITCKQEFNEFLTDNGLLVIKV